MATLPLTVSVIKLKTLTNQLEEEEFDSFLCKLWRQIGKETMMHLLCTRVLKEFGDDIGDQLEEMHRITSNIIQSRGPGSRRKQEQQTTMNSLPSTIIGEIASYHDQYSYARFSRINRKIFVDSNSPNRLTSLIMQDVVGTIPNLSHFAGLTHCEFGLKEFDLFIRNDARAFCNCRYLHSLSITGGGNTVILQSIINHPSICFARITKLWVNQFHRLKSIGANQFIAILSKFPSIESLALNHVHITNTLPLNQLRECCPNLHELYVMHCGAALDLALAWSSKSTHLYFKPVSVESANAIARCD